MDREQFIELSSQYALGALEPAESKQFEEYISRASREELEILNELIASASLLPLSLERKSPHPRVKAQLMQRIALSTRAAESAMKRTEELLPERRSSRNWFPWGVGAVLGMIALFSLYLISLLGTIADQNSKLAEAERQNSSLQTRLVELEGELTKREEQLKVLAAKEVHISIMNGLVVNPVGYGKIIWDPEKKEAILHVSNLPAVPTDKDYQLWVIKNKKPISAGVFSVADREATFLKIDNLAVVDPQEINAFAVTLEPKGGMPQPTGDMYLMGAPNL